MFLNQDGQAMCATRFCCRGSLHTGCAQTGHTLKMLVTCIGICFRGYSGGFCSLAEGLPAVSVPPEEVSVVTESQARPGEKVGAQSCCRGACRLGLRV